MKETAIRNKRPIVTKKSNILENCRSPDSGANFSYRTVAIVIAVNIVIHIAVAIIPKKFFL